MVIQFLNYQTWGAITGVLEDEMYGFLGPVLQMLVPFTRVTYKHYNT